MSTVSYGFLWFPPGHEIKLRVQVDHLALFTRMRFARVFLSPAVLESFRRVTSKVPCNRQRLLNDGFQLEVVTQVLFPTTSKVIQGF